MQIPHPASPLLPHCEPSLPALAYYDPDWFAEERQKIWAGHWIYAGRVNDLPPMTMRRVEIAGQNLIVVRDREGAITVFHNTCRHRGSELCTEPEKALTSKLISCPYHQWSYGLDGRLVRTPFVSITPDFRKEDFSLYGVSVRLWNGFIFLCLADDPPPFDLAPDLGVDVIDNWPMDSLITGHTLVKHLDCNWKIFWENYNECLHCPGIHPELSATVPVYSKGYMAANEAPGWTPEQGAGPSLRQGATTWSMDGRACGPEFPNLTSAEREAGQLFVTMLPTMFIVAHVDYVRTVSLRPLGPEKTELRAEWLFSPETLAQPDFDLGNVVDFATLVMTQDGMACEMNQRGLRSAKFTQGVLTPQEFDVHRFHEWIRRRMA
ncbi:MAG: aromatic ring-hydroxylating dioxygenase subunit alpha [Rhizobium sp.]|nr:aromatic ring-hydroxylating dioxygenase subunit alpha [Rhizobium sp.]